jgi:hypothetical protein
MNLQRIGTNAVASKIHSIVNDALQSPGEPLDSETRAFMEPRFAYDFSQIRVHTNDKASESAKAVNALAYTVGSHIVFGSRQYNPTSAAGKSLIAHELTHTIQQGLGIQRSVDQLAISDPGDLAEKEADLAASAVLHGAHPTISRHQAQISRYGHSNSCKQKDHLEEFIWPGHGNAKSAVDRTISETGGSSLNPKVKSHIVSFFGQGSTDPGNLAAINSNFQKIRNVLDTQFIYHCSEKGAADKDALRCHGQNAETDTSGKKDITLCFDQIKTWWNSASIAGAAWLIIHENFHRAIKFGHTWEAGKFDKCLLNPPGPASPDLENADAYACSAAIIGNTTP